MKKTLALALAMMMAATMLLTGCGSGGSEERVVNVCSWGEYIDEDLIYQFEEETGIKVNYQTAESNEALYSLLKTGAGDYDVIVPSDYMIGRLIAEDMLAELNYDNIPNYALIDDQYKNLSYDPDNKYTVPYTWGTLGIIYNTSMVDEEITSWDAMFDEKYAGQVLMIRNSRDALAAALLDLGYNINTTDEAELQACADKLSEQRGVVQQYVMDQIFDAMENEEAWIAPYYAGDYLTMVEENPDLAFYRPDHQGFNVFIDAMCIPSCCQEKEAAELFINFLCDPEISAANMDYIGYSVPASESKQYMDQDVVNDPGAYPDEDELRNASSFDYLPEETSRYMESLFMTVRNG